MDVTGYVENTLISSFNMLVDRLDTIESKLDKFQQNLNVMEFNRNGYLNNEILGYPFNIHKNCKNEFISSAIFVVDTQRSDVITDQWWKSINDGSKSRFISVVPSCVIEKLSKVLSDEKDNILPYLRCTEYSITSHHAHIQDYYIDKYFRSFKHISGLTELDNGKIFILYDNVACASCRDAFRYVVDILVANGVNEGGISMVNMIETTTLLNRNIYNILPLDINKKQQEKQVNANLQSVDNKFQLLNELHTFKTMLSSSDIVLHSLANDLLTIICCQQYTTLT